MPFYLSTLDLQLQMYDTMIMIQLSWFSGYVDITNAYWFPFLILSKLNFLPFSLFHLTTDLTGEDALFDYTLYSTEFHIRRVKQLHGRLHGKNEMTCLSKNFIYQT